MTSRKRTGRPGIAGKAFRELSEAAIRRCSHVGLRTRLMLTHGLCIVPLVLLIGFALDLQFRSQLERGVELAEHAAEHLAAEHASIMGQARDALEQIARIGLEDGGDRSHCDLGLADVVAANDWATNAALLAPDGTVRCHSFGRRAPASYADWRLWERVRAADGMVVSDLLVSKVTGLPILAAAMPLRDAGGRLTGMAAVAIDPDLLVKYLMARFQDVDLVALVIDSEGRLAARKPESPFVGLSIAATPLAQWALAGASEPAEFTSLDGIERLYVQRPVPGTGLRVVVGIEDSRLVAGAWRYGLLAALAVIGTLALSALIAGVSSAAFVVRDARRMAMAAESGRNLAGVELGLAAAPELRALHAAYRAMAERLRDYAEASSDWWWETDTEHRFTAFSERFEEVLGIAPARLLGRHRWDSRRDDPADGDWDAYRRTVEAQEPFRDFTYAILDDAGNRRVLQVSGRPVFDPDGSFKGYRGIGRDITLHHRLEQDLAAAVTRMRAVLDTLVDAVITINRSGTIESANPAAERMFGYPVERLIGRNVAMLMPEPHRSAHDGYLRRYFATGESQVIGRHRELTAQRADGSVFPIELTVAPMQLDGATMFVGIVRDITERRKVDQLKAEFVSTVSHELRTPLTSIVGSLALISGGAVGEIPERARRMIQIAHKNGERLVHLVNDILDLEKLESGRMEFDLEPVRLRQALEQALEANRPYADKHEVRLCLAPGADDGTALVDQHRLGQVLANLISNAVKFSPAGGEVTLGLVREGEELVLSVADRGRGIPDAFKSRIFGRFAQADASDTREKGGTGLGLSITKSIVERLGGRIDFESELGRGTTFFVRLPVWSGGTIEPERTATPARILVCETDTAAATRLRAVLESNGFAVDVTRPTDLAQAMAENAYAAVMLHLPPSDDGDIGRSLSGAAPGAEPLPVVVLSADAAGLGGAAPPERAEDCATGARLLRSIATAVHGRAGATRILHVEDDPDIATVVAQALEDPAVEVVRAASLAEARRRLAQDGPFDLAVLDVGLPDGSGLDLLDPLIGQGDVPTVPTIIFSAQEVPEICRSRAAATLIKSRASLEDLVSTVQTLAAAHRHRSDRARPTVDGGSRHDVTAEESEAWQSCSA
ncbi:PAS domain S-box protein [Benzoatithermus flavus]|uniref:histidine kinase n=1 Tax=Benzoatithermus flavus TaxID=3108223 RepID=A0ABU8XQS9_9PROT